MDNPVWSAQKVLATSGAYWETCTLHAAVELDLFSRLGDACFGAEDLARQMDADRDAVGRLLTALAAMGLVEQTGRGYTNTAASRDFLCKDSENYLGYIIRHHHYLVPGWSRLDEAVVSGLPVRSRPTEGGERRREAFLMGMFNLASQLAPLLVPAVDLSTRRRLLDLGGGPGTYAIHFCRHYPELSATVFDLATSRPFAEKTIQRMDMAARVDFVAGDYHQDELPGGFDVVWLSHILHAEPHAACQKMLQKAYGALDAGGMAVVHEFILDDDQNGPLFPALFSLNMLLGTDGGRAYSQGQLEQMLAASGFVDIQRLAFSSPNGSGLVQAVKPTSATT